MKTKVARWGNSLALRIPKKLASSHQLDEGSDVEIIEDEGELRLRRAEPKSKNLEELLESVTKENLHEEFGFGAMEGKEAW